MEALETEKRAAHAVTPLHHMIVQGTEAHDAAAAATGITWSKLQGLFDRPATEAADALECCQTTFKRVQRIWCQVWCCGRTGCAARCRAAEMALLVSHCTTPHHPRTSTLNGCKNSNVVCKWCIIRLTSGLIRMDVFSLQRSLFPASTSSSSR
jgi:hypothetical protein